MYTLSVHIMIFSEEPVDIDFTTLPNPTWKIKVRKKGEALFTNSRTSLTMATSHFISFEKVIVFENTFNETIILEKLKDIFIYIHEKKIEGEKNVYFSYIVEKGQFAFELSTDFMRCLVDNGFNLQISGVYFT